MNETVKKIDAYLEQFVGSTMEQIIMQEAKREIEKLIKERDEVNNKYNELVKSPVLAFVKNKWNLHATGIEIVLTHDFMRECPDFIVEHISTEIKHAMMTEMNKSSSTEEWTPVRFGSSLKKTIDKYEPIMKKISELDGEK